MSESDAWREGVCYLPEGDALEPGIQNRAECRSDESTVEYEPSLADFEYIQEILTCEIVVPVGHDVEGSGTDEGPNNDPRPKVSRLLRREAVDEAPPPCCPKPSEKARRHKDAVPMNIKTSE